MLEPDILLVMNKFDWFKKKPGAGDKNKEGLKILQQSLNEKYGNYDYGHDLREHDDGKEFNLNFKQIINTTLDNPQKILLVGSNDGREVPLIRELGELTAVDLSDVALDKLRATYPDITTVVSDIESLPFEDNSFDTYIGMRTLHASNIDLDKALNEALRVTTKTWIISVSNGYVVEGEVVKGMYDYDNGEILKDLPYRYVDEIVEFFKKHNIQSHTEETTSEIIIVAKSL